MSTTYDVFAETNPAYCACALAKFTKAFLEEETSGPELPMVYLALPLALSGDLGSSFEKTNRNTGLSDWLERNPQIQVGLAERLNGSIDIVTEAIRFGCFSRILTMDRTARLNMGDRKIKNAAVDSLSEWSVQPMKRAERLGYWFASAGSTKTVFDALGVTV